MLLAIPISTVLLPVFAQFPIPEPPELIIPGLILIFLLAMSILKDIEHVIRLIIALDLSWGRSIAQAQICTLLHPPSTIKIGLQFCSNNPKELRQTDCQDKLCTLAGGRILNAIVKQ